jgi:hypothetical protein
LKTVRKEKVLPVVPKIERVLQTTGSLPLRTYRDNAEEKIFYATYFKQTNKQTKKFPFA